MITGGYYYDSWVAFPEILEADEAGVVVSAECAHLFSDSAQDGNELIFLVRSYLTQFLIIRQALEYAGTAFTMFKMFDLEHEVQKHLGGQVNTLFNVLTLSLVVHNNFDRFAIWLEEVPGQERSTLCQIFHPGQLNPILETYICCGNG